MRTTAVRAPLQALLPITVGIVLTIATACSPADSAWISPIAFDSATVWFHGATDSVPLVVEIASDEEQRAFGLSRRPSLDPGSGMLFEFDTLQAADHGFWMWRTRIPLDIAFVDSAGVIQRVLGMPTCGSRAETCPEHPPGVEYARAIEANLGWFSTNDVGVGTRVTVDPR